MKKHVPTHTQGFTPRSKMADLIAANYTLVLVVPRFGIPLGFGEKSVQEVCDQHNVSVGFFLLVCNLYTFDDYFPDREQLENIDLSGLIPYLKASHRYYLNERLPHIGRHLASIADHAGQHYGTALRSFMDNYRRQVADHFACEEQEVFPYILQLQQGEKPEQQVASNFIESHAELVDNLSDLPKILYKYLPTDGSVEELSELLFAILQLSADLEKHALIEERILLPLTDCQSAAASQQPERRHA